MFRVPRPPLRPIRLRHNACLHADKTLGIRFGAAGDESAGISDQPMAEGLLEALEATEAAQDAAIQADHLAIGAGRRLLIPGSGEYED